MAETRLSTAIAELYDAVLAVRRYAEEPYEDTDCAESHRLQMVMYEKCDAVTDALLREGSGEHD